MNFLFSPYFENISTYYSPCKVLSRNSYRKSDYFNCNFRIWLLPLLNSKVTVTSWAELAQRGSDVEVSTQQNKRGYFLLHLERCEGSQDSFLRFWAEVCVVGALLLKITAKKASMNRKFPFTVQRRVGTFILSGKALFAFTGRSSILLDTQLFAFCILRLNVCFTQAFHEKGTRKYLKPGSVPAIRKKNSNHIWAGLSNGGRIFICHLC